MTERIMYFPERKKGYDKEQVDRYITKLAAAYRTAHDEYKALQNKYNNLLHSMYPDTEKAVF